MLGSTSIGSVEVSTVHCTLCTVHHTGVLCALHTRLISTVRHTGFHSALHTVHCSPYRCTQCTVHHTGIHCSLHPMHYSVSRVYVPLKWIWEEINMTEWDNSGDAISPVRIGGSMHYTCADMGKLTIQLHALLTNMEKINHAYRKH